MRTIPFCYNYLSFLYDADIIRNIPKTFGGLQDGDLKKKILLPDPETSSIGRGLLLWSVGLFEVNGYRHFWKSVKRNIYQLTENYDDSINRFYAKEAPIVLGFLTELENSQPDTNYNYFIPQEGYLRYIDGIAISKNTKKLFLVNNFINYVLNEEFQTIIAENKFMFPVNKLVLEDVVKTKINKPDKDAWKKLKKYSIKHQIKYWISRWKKTMGK